MYKLGVRYMELLNKFDNPLAGVRVDGGETGVLVNSANKLETGTFWQIADLPGARGDKEQPDVRHATALIGNGFAALGRRAHRAAYPAPPHCNTRGLTDLGEYVVRRMMDKRMIVDPDHMSQAPRDEVLAMLEARGYSGVISSHSWTNAGLPAHLQARRRRRPAPAATEGYVEEWKKFRSCATAGTTSASATAPT